MNVALVHDYLVQYGGAERVVEALHEVWPQAPVYTSLYDAEAMPPLFRELDVRTSFLQGVPGLARRSKLGLAAYPAAFRSLDLSAYDVVVSSSSGWAHAARTAPDAVHVVYCHTPARWLYRTHSYVAAERIPAAPLLPLLRRWDRGAARRPTHYLANSETTRARIAHQYGRDAVVVHPPVDTSRFAVGEAGDYYLCASRLTAYKRVDLAIEACEELGVPLVVAGDGSARRALERRASGDVEFLGRVGDGELARLLARCRALIVPAEEDFCITAVEAMASGRPVVGYARGGLLETVALDRTGVLFGTQTPASLVGALIHLESLDLDPHAIRAHALRFDLRLFQRRMRELVEGAASGLLVTDCYLAEPAA
jgi:glycosyltransferase involved in cell wall biosynthesis